MRKDREIQLVKDETARFWQIKKVVVIPIVVGALATITIKFEKYTESLEIGIRTEHVQKSAKIVIIAIIVIIVILIRRRKKDATVFIKNI